MDVIKMYLVYIYIYMYQLWVQLWVRPVERLILNFASSVIGRRACLTIDGIPFKFHSSENHGTKLQCWINLTWRRPSPPGPAPPSGLSAKPVAEQKTCVSITTTISLLAICMRTAQKKNTNKPINNIWNQTKWTKIKENNIHRGREGGKEGRKGGFSREGKRSYR